jgi:hypothetical protein
MIAHHHQQINTRHCTPVHGGAKVTPKAKAQVLENTLGSAVATPTESGVLSRPDFLGALAMRRARDFGRDGFVRKAGRTAEPVFSTSRPPAALENAAGGFESRSGAKTMTTTTTPASLRTAYALSQAHHALARHVPDMAHGFTIQTGYGQINIPPGPTAKRITALVEKMLRAELADAAKTTKQGGAAC